MALYRVIKTVHFRLQNGKKNHFVVVQITGVSKIIEDDHIQF